ncbi:hypothetical protein DUI87_16338 [Hirundo rustica rustica]|uniref:Uncharacterized protein n=1 Tax=Hirundo rustica rustica TaxID=333673 RepID=A0A3M0K1M9_HIRRU|nr:hypothetical protein DUI87_16338 [Hirundo rustica rustica]
MTFFLPPSLTMRPLKYETYQAVSLQRTRKSMRQPKLGGTWLFSLVKGLFLCTYLSMVSPGMFSEVKGILSLEVSIKEMTYEEILIFSFDNKGLDQFWLLFYIGFEVIIDPKLLTLRRSQCLEISKAYSTVYHDIETVQRYVSKTHYLAVVVILEMPSPRKENTGVASVGEKIKIMSDFLG